MLAGFVDHVWQSTWTAGGIWLLAFIARGNFAALRLWLWRVAALKFVIPFTVMFAVGGWLGFPRPHTADPAPAALIRAFAVLTPLASPARAHAWAGMQLLIAIAAALLCAGACAFWLRRRLDIERQRADDEAVRRERDLTDVVPFPGFFSSALLTACALCVVGTPLLAGAVGARQRHLERLVANSLALRGAHLDMTQAAPGSGWHYRIEASAHGVAIRNVSIQDLIAIVYGINHYSVMASQMISDTDPDKNFWLTSPRYNLRAEGFVPEPDDFDPYALRQSVTKLLADRFGLELYLNQKCQPPCGTYGVPLSPSPL
jgi:hypothetical protein